MLRYNMNHYMIILRDEDGEVVRKTCVFARTKAAALAMIHDRRDWRTATVATLSREGARA